MIIYRDNNQFYILVLFILSNSVIFLILLGFFGIRRISTIYMRQDSGYIFFCDIGINNISKKNNIIQRDNIHNNFLILISSLLLYYQQDIYIDFGDKINKNNSIKNYINKQGINCCQLGPFYIGFVYITNLYILNSSICFFCF